VKGNWGDGSRARPLVRDSKQPSDRRKACPKRKDVEMKKAALFAVCLFVLFSCEENDWDFFDSGLEQQAMTKKCARYVDREIEEPGDGLSWERALPSVEEAIESAKQEVGEEAECEIRVKGEVEDMEFFTTRIPQSGNIKIVDNLDGTENLKDFHKIGVVKNKQKISRISSQFENSESENTQSHTKHRLLDQESDSDNAIISDVDFKLSSEFDQFEPDTSNTRSFCTCDGFTNTNPNGSTNFPYFYNATNSPSYHRLFVGRNSNENIEFYVGDLYGKIYYNQDESDRDHPFYITSENTSPSYEENIYLQPGGNDVLTLLEAGKVGIGTTSPDSMLHIHNADNAYAYTHITHSGTGTSTTDGAYFGLAYVDPFYNLQIANWESGNISFWQGGSVSMMIDSTGEVGIGTTDPSAELHVKDASSHASIIIDSDTGDDSALKIWENSTQKWKIYNDGDDSDKLKLMPGTAGSVITFQSNGNVGIGTTSPDALLAVDGEIHAEEITVDLSVPDYVFGPGYDLMTLEEVECYISDKSHLPGIPSAADAEVHGGVSLGDAHAALLQKVEELTLYLIEQNKELKAQKEEIKEIKTQVASCGR
jgi:hypothetical protein